MRRLRNYVTVDIEFGQLWYDVRTRWNNRSEWQRTQRRWDSRVASWQREMDEFDECERLLDASDLGFEELLDLQMLLMKRDIRRDFRRRFFGDGPAKEPAGLSSIAAVDHAMKLEYAPLMWREMQRPSALWKDLDDDSSA